MTSVSLAGNGTDIHNAGTIETLGPEAAAIFLGGTVVGSTASLTNTGTITAPGDGIRLGTGFASVSLVNSGLIEAGDEAYLDSGSSNDTIVNSGTIRGDFILGNGNDLLDSRTGLVEGEVWGGTGNDRVYTGAGVQLIFGEAGTDVLMGGAGGDLINGGSENDTAAYNSATSGVKVSLADQSLNTGDAKGDSFVSIERLLGSNFADTLIGDANANYLTGGLGADTLTGGAGVDRFVFNTKPAGFGASDRITDFVTNTDEIRLDDAAFSGLVLGNLALGAFRASASALAGDASDRILYETDTGILRFDADGNGAGAAVTFGRLASGLNLGADDFLVY
jgi:serralysin